MASKGRWIVVADSRRAKLFHGSLTDQGSPHLEQKSALELDEEAHAHQHGRPSPLKGKSGNSYASDHDEKDALSHRFAKDVAGWLGKHAQTIEDPGIALFAPPRFLGHLRKELPKQLSDRIAELKADLTSLPLSDLTKHPQVLEQLGG
jgi:protein required for attachment to host cells